MRPVLDSRSFEEVEHPGGLDGRPFALASPRAGHAAAK